MRFSENKQKQTMRRGRKLTSEPVHSPKGQIHFMFHFPYGLFFFGNKVKTKAEQANCRM